ncbi:patatin-like phospholipase family protein [Skermania sp. ID1734]|uniref:patatin-like phospholipase family protein n=1 Tax=Skermania sp. ID1734 TaxID=2597516 RepID=UPI001180D1E2|nr:patatin-like phospholipase family protein [Skermania sp. ID1734]TSE01854.1 patatin-like phospholipase family protein [Skermania sp. ID1734]
MTTAFVLSGGASLGAVEVGMLQALARRDIRPDVIIGTSAGALNGAWLAAGSSPEDLDELAQVWIKLKRSTVFPVDPLNLTAVLLGRSDHLVSDSGIRKLLKDNLRFERMEDAPIPLHVVVTDVLTGKDVLVSKGDAIDAISASAAIPGVLPTVTIDGRIFMDGGAVNNTPITHAVQLGADPIWVLPTGAPCALTRQPRTALGMALHGLTLAINHRMASDVSRFESVVDLRVAPPLCPLEVNPADFSHAEEMIDRARVQTAEWLDAGPVRAGQANLLIPHGH